MAVKHLTPAQANGMCAAYPKGDTQVDGVSKREYFAAAALTGLLACAANDLASEDAARVAVQCADVLLHTLEKVKP